MTFAMPHDMLIPVVICLVCLGWLAGFITGLIINGKRTEDDDDEPDLWLDLHPEFAKIPTWGVLSEKRETIGEGLTEGMFDPGVTTELHERDNVVEELQPVVTGDSSWGK